MAARNVTDLDSLTELVEDMILQLTYPGYDGRALKLGLPDEVTGLPARIFGQALNHESVYVRLAGLRWFQERPGIAKAHMRNIHKCLSDPDDWVRKEALLLVERLEKVDNDVIQSIVGCLTDTETDVRKGAAKALGKLGNKSEAVLTALRKAAEDKNVEVRFKAQKALRKLGGYVA